jgi:hypothetical protein
MIVILEGAPLPEKTVVALSIGCGLPSKYSVYCMYTDTAYLFKFEIEIATYEAHILGSAVECSISPKNIACLMLVKLFSHPAL